MIMMYIHSPQSGPASSRPCSTCRHLRPQVGDKIVNPDGHTYEILERLGHGTFGQAGAWNPGHARIDGGR